jgi:predicted small secreted protein
MMMKRVNLLVVSGAFTLSACASTTTGTEETMSDTSAYDKPGYVTQVSENRLWVFPADSDDYKQFLEHGEPVKLVTRIGEGPDGMTIKSTDSSIIDGYLLGRPGYVTEVHDGRLWVFVEGSEDYEKFRSIGEPAKVVTRIGEGPGGMTIKAVDGSIIDGYLAAQ